MSVYELFTPEKRAMVDALLRHGVSVADAAREAGVNVKTVRSYRRRRKLGVKVGKCRPRKQPEERATRLRRTQQAGASTRELAPVFPADAESGGSAAASPAVEHSDSIPVPLVADATPER